MLVTGIYQTVLQYHDHLSVLAVVLCGVLVVMAGWYLRRRMGGCVSKEHYRNLAEATFEGVLLSRNGVICDCNEKALEITGFSREALLGRPLLDLFERSFHDTIRFNIQRGYDQLYEAVGIRHGGERYPVEIRGKTFVVGGHTMRASSLQDISSRKQEEAQLRKLSAAVEHSPASIVITDADGLIEYVNPAFRRLTGYSLDEAVGQNPRILKAGDQSAEFYRNLWEILRRGEEWRGEFHNKRKDGTLFWESASISPIFDETGRISNYVAVKEDISEKKQLQDRLEQMAQFDMLTGLPNRRMFLDRLAQSVAVAKRSEQRFGLIYVDLDGFKRINDNYGHDAGDRVLKTVAARLAACLRISDTAGRIGGDEFTIILGALSHYNDAGQVAEKILAALRRPITLPGGHRETIGSSVGISVFPEDAQDGDGLLATADDAMYSVKHNGKNGYCFYHACRPASAGTETI